MKTITDRFVDRMEGVEDIEMMELGAVSEETKGGSFGSTWDSGGRKWP